MLSELKPAKGLLLISEPFMVDPMFKRSVVFITDHDEDGSVGFVLNQPLGIGLQDIVDDDLKGFNAPVFCGGPVQQDMLHFLHRLGDLIPESIHVGNGIYWGGDFERIIELIQENQLTPNQIKFFIGYSGWSKQQLNMEFDENSWIVGTTNAQFIFSASTDLWKSAIKTLGNKYAHIANFPENPSLN